ncbi:hypothetical protein [Brevibacillus centrosporus]|uniref:hypothetical protein n=1 Tax=Brevibacillus centrosporus TaxID=54910 RepID=UPI003B020A61
MDSRGSNKSWRNAVNEAVKKTGIDKNRRCIGGIIKMDSPRALLKLAKACQNRCMMKEDLNKSVKGILFKLNYYRKTGLMGFNDIPILAYSEKFEKRYVTYIEYDLCISYCSMGTRITATLANDEIQHRRMECPGAN